MLKDYILDENTNVCDIKDCIKKIEGFPSNSASPSDTWVIEFKKNTFYQSEKIYTGFLKIFINPKSAIKFKIDTDNLLLLDYELKIYRDVIRPLVDLNICTNFVKYLASGEKCSYDDLFNMLKYHIYHNKSEIDPVIIKQLLNRNINIMKKEQRYRKAINDIVIDKYDDISKPEDFTFDIIMNEQIPSNSKKFSDILKEMRGVDNSPLFPILFQIAAGCYAMSLSKMVHNDIHAGNIFLEKFDKPRTFFYIINGKQYKITSNYKVLIYDFDRSYCERFGKNTPLDKDPCEYGGQCNIYCENKDIIKSFCYLFYNKSSKNDKFLANVLKIIAKDPKKVGANLYDYLHSCFFTKKVIKNHDLLKKDFYDSETIIERLYSYIDHKKDKNIDKNNINICDKEFFNKDGTINKLKYDEIFTKTIISIIGESPRKDEEEDEEEPKKKEEKPCRSDQIKNPETGKCVLKTGAIGKKILAGMGGTAPEKPKKKEEKPCRSDQIRNPETGKCVLKTGAVGKKIIAAMGGAAPEKPKKEEPKKKEVKPCRSDQIRNPETGKCVLKTGAVGKKILAGMGGAAPEKPKKKEEKEPKKKEEKPCRSDQIRNPETGKCVLKTGAIGKKILTGMGGAFDINKKEIPKNKDKFEIKRTLADGNCFYSAIYRSAKYKNLIEKLSKCLSINCDNEKDFIKNFRNYLSNRYELKEKYSNFFNHITNQLNIDSKEFKNNLKHILKNIGDVRDVVKKFIKENKFKLENFDDFFNEVQKIIRKNYSYVGEIEVLETSELLDYNCNINTKIFTNKKNAENFIKNISDIEYNRVLVLIINQSAEHWEYM